MEMKFNQDGLIPAIIQNVETKAVLMLGYMNQEAFEKTIETKKVTFYSRSKQRLWTKGETTNHFLELVSIKNDCDQDALLIQALPKGPTCHTGTITCWGDDKGNELNFINELEGVIENRKNNPNEDSYIAGLFKKGINKIAQKVGEEAVEVVIEAIDQNEELFLEEAADLFFHYLILLKARGNDLNQVLEILKSRVK